MKLIVVRDAALQRKQAEYFQGCVYVYLQEVYPPARLGGRIRVLDYRSKRATWVSDYSSMKAELLFQFSK